LIDYPRDRKHHRSDLFPTRDRKEFLEVRTTEPGNAKVKLGGRFHRLFGATLVSATGTGMHAAALPLLVLQLTSSPVALSLVVVAVEIPWLRVALHSGLVVDRLD